MAEEYDFDDPLHPRRAIALGGQAEGEAAFLAAWTSGRLAHAWLISGPRGIGKATLAFRIARFVLAGGHSGGGGLFGDAAPTLDMDPGHPIFRRVASGGHADFAYVERGWSDDSKPKRKAEISVEQVRGIGSFLSLTPAEGAWRVVLVDAVDEMSRSAANAILKVLEEPPRNALLLLLAHSPGRVLPTIRSRCRRLPLRPLDDRIVAGLLGRLRPDVTLSDALSIARLSEGSVGRAIGLADEGGLTLYRDMVALLSGLPRLDHQALHTFGDRVAKDEAVFRTTMTLFLWWLTRGAGAWAARPQADQETQREVVDGEFTLQRRLVTAAGLDRWVEVWEKTTHLFDRAEAVNLDRKQVVLNAFFALERLGHR